ncbi:MAG: hypothetical protein ACYDHN_12010 [Solirubrobacteraceae bacterium]
MRRSLLGLLLAAALLAAIGVSPAAAQPPGTPHWLITSASGPTFFKPGDEGDYYRVIATNDGSRATEEDHVSISDTIPTWATATEIVGQSYGSSRFRPLSCTLATLTCTNETGESEVLSIEPGESLVITVVVSVAPEAPLGAAGSPNEATISGSGPEASVKASTTLNGSPAPFGMSYLVTDITGSDGEVARQAGSHPLAMTTAFAFNVESLMEGREVFGGRGPLPGAEARNVEVSLPPGLVGDPNALPRCPAASFETVNGSGNCPSDTQVGTMRLFFYGDETSPQTVPVYNVVPPGDQPAELGFTIAGFAHTAMFFKVRSGSEGFGLTAKLSEITEADPVQAGILTIWGVPADAGHNHARESTLEGCTAGSEGGCASNAQPAGFLRMPTRCDGQPLSFAPAAESWQSPGFAGLDPWTVPGALGCQQLTFGPSISAQPLNPLAGQPSGYKIGVEQPQSTDPNVLATPDLRDAVITLPAGTVISPSAASGLQSCSDEQFNRDALTPASCPPSSQIGTVTTATPLLEKPLQGQLFLGTPRCAPCSPADAQEGRMIRLLLQVQGAGVILKLEGSTDIDQSSGALTTSFDENPQLPFEVLEVTLKDGPRAPLTNALACNVPLAANAQLTPYSGGSPAEPASAPFELSGCGAPQFNPSFLAGTTSSRAGAFSSEIVSFARSDRDQDLAGVTLHSPPGLLGELSHVTPCPEVLAQDAACGAASEIGTVTTGVGAGSEPFYVGGKVFLTSSYKGAPFGLSIVIPAIAGPLNLGTVNVRAKIDIDPTTAALTVTSDPLPQSLDGIPLHTRIVNVSIDRPGFIFNATNCAAQAIQASLTSAQGSTASVSSHYQVANCATLPFAPTLTALTQAHTSKANGAYLHVKVTSGPGQANIGKVKVDLPKQLPSRLTTLQKACLAAVFQANPGACPAASIVGHATANTPVLKQALSGPAYLVSYGGAKFPDLEMVLQGEGITLVLDGATQIKHGITSSVFRTLPDAPVSTFDLVLPTGPHSVLAGFGSLCRNALNMPTEITGQNGKVIKRATKVAVSGCPRPHRTHRARRRRSG